MRKYGSSVGCNS